MKPALFVLTVLLSISAASSRAEEVRVVYFTFDPLIREAGGHATGPLVDIIHQMSDGLDLRFDAEPMPIKRTLMVMRTEPVLLPVLARTPQRENDYIWLGQLYCDDLVMATLPPAAPVDSLDQARALKSIGTGRGGVGEDFLIRNGFETLETSSNMFLDARKLREGRVDGWFAFRLNILAAWRRTGGTPDELRIGSSLSSVCLWMAASKSMPPATVDKLRANLGRLIEDHTVAHALDELAR